MLSLLAERGTNITLESAMSMYYYQFQLIVNGIIKRTEQRNNNSANDNDGAQAQLARQTKAMQKMAMPTVKMPSMKL